MLVIVLGRQGDHSCEEAVGGRGGCAGLGLGAGAQAESGGAGRRAPPHTRGSRDPPARVGVVGEGFSRRGQGPRSGGPGVGTSASVQSRCSALSRSRCRARAPWGWRIRAPGSRLGSRCGLVPGGGACPLPASPGPTWSCVCKFTWSESALHACNPPASVLAGALRARAPGRLRRAACCWLGPSACLGRAPVVLRTSRKFQALGAWQVGVPGGKEPPPDRERRKVCLPGLARRSTCRQRWGGHACAPRWPWPGPTFPGARGARPRGLFSAPSPDFCLCAFRRGRSSPGFSSAPFRTPEGEKPS